MCLIRNSTRRVKWVNVSDHRPVTAIGRKFPILANLTMVKFSRIDGKTFFTTHVKNSVSGIVNLPFVEHAKGVGEMTNILKKTALVAVVTMMSVQPVHACWSTAAQDAAKIKHLNTMLMVTALRCRNTADNFLPQYNRFVTKHNALIGSQNNVLKTHLSATYGAGGAINALDRMSIGYANSYGNGHRSMDCRQLKELATKLASESHGVVTMAAAADFAVTGQSWSGQPCPVNIARRP